MSAPSPAKAGLAIFVVVAVLTHLGHSEWIPASVMYVVGLPFLPLAVVFQYLLAVTYPLASSAGPASPSGLLGAGLILWVSALGAVTATPSIERMT